MASARFEGRDDRFLTTQLLITLGDIGGYLDDPDHLALNLDREVGSLQPQLPAMFVNALVDATVGMPLTQLFPKLGIGG